MLVEILKQWLILKSSGIDKVPCIYYPGSNYVLFSGDGLNQHVFTKILEIKKINLRARL